MQEYKKQQNIMIVLLFAVALIWGLGFVLTKQLLDYLSPMLINILRFGIATVIMFCLYFKKIIRLKWKEIGIGAVSSIFLTIGFVLQTYGIKFTSTSNSALLTGLNVVIVPFFAWILYKKHPPIKSFVAAIIAFLSIALLSFGGVSQINIGDLLCFLCAISFAMHYIVISKTSSLVDTSALAFLQMFFATLAFIIIGFVFEPQAIITSTFNSSVFLPIIILGVFSTCFAFVIQTTAQKYVSPSKTSLILSTESTFGAILAVILKMDAISWYLALSIIGVTIALIISEYPTKKSFTKLPTNPVDKTN